MKEVTLKVKAEKYQFFLELIKSLDFVQIEDEGDSKEEIIANLKEGFREMKAFKEGKTKGTPIEDFLNELWNTAFWKLQKRSKAALQKIPIYKNQIGFLTKELSENPRIGISLGNDVYKIRLSIKSKGKGKSGGARVITFVKTDIETVMLLSIYSKGERATLTDSEIKNLLKDFL